MRSKCKELACVSRDPPLHCSSSSSAMPSLNAETLAGCWVYKHFFHAFVSCSLQSRTFWKVGRNEDGKAVSSQSTAKEESEVPCSHPVTVDSTVQLSCLQKEFLSIRKSNYTQRRSQSALHFRLSSGLWEGEGEGRGLGCVCGDRCPHVTCNCSCFLLKFSLPLWRLCISRYCAFKLFFLKCVTFEWKILNAGDTVTTSVV
jgi:hypothetical protein